MGEVQKVHNVKGISKETFILHLFLGLLIGLISGFLICSLKILYSCLILAIITYFAWKKGRRFLFLFIAIFLLSFVISLLLNLIPAKNGYTEGSGIIISSKSNYYILLIGFKRYYVYEKDCIKEFGDIIQIKGYVTRCSFAEYESRFSFNNYLQLKGVKDSISVNDISFVFRNPIRLRERELNFLTRFDSLTTGTIDMIAFSRKDYSNSNVALASSIGCLNILSGSGMLFGGALRALEKLFSYKFDEKKTKVITFIFGIMLFAFFLGKAGAYRILMLKVIEIAELLAKGKRENRLFNISLSGIILLALNPYFALNSGFLIGYGLSFFLMFAGSYFSKMKKRKRRFMNFILLNIFLFPLFNINGDLILLAPLFSFLLLPFVYSFSFLTLISFVSVPFVNLLKRFSLFLNDYLTIIEKISFSVPIGSFSLTGIYIYYLILFLIIYFKDVGLTHFASALSIIQMMFLLLQSLPLENHFVSEVDFINVGQGDSILIRDKNTTVMIDTGGVLSFDMAKEVLIPFLRKRKIYKIDCLIASHQDYDHIGAKDSLISNFTIKKYVDSKKDFPLKINNLTFNNYNVYEANDENEKSLFLSTYFMGKTFLFTGDADTTIEKKILEDNPSLRADVLKIGHHGSKTSSSYNFLKQISPEVCIISVGQNNKYGHPDKDVINRLDKLNIKYRRTDLEGTISYKTYFDRPLGDL